MPGLITLTTDFGTQDAYVGAMKGVILGIAPDVRLVDISHDIAPQDVMEGAFVVRDAAFYFPPETIHLIVVDPGVGTDRRPVALRCRGHFFVGPDNGILPLLLDGAEPDA
ncbi:MAG: SAM-dependent chlorinase/fluorinase, partial [Rhodothermales bacterium]